MAAAALSASRTFRRTDSSFKDSRNSALLLDVPQLPEKKEWIADYTIEMLMLDG
jgi:hypothetical protein